MPSYGNTAQHRHLEEIEPCYAILKSTNSVTELSTTPDGIKQLHIVHGKFIEPPQTLNAYDNLRDDPRTLTMQHTTPYRLLASGNEAQDAWVDNARLSGGSRAIVSVLEIFGRI